MAEDEEDDVPPDDYDAEADYGTTPAPDDAYPDGEAPATAEELREGLSGGDEDGPGPDLEETGVSRGAPSRWALDLDRWAKRRGDELLTEDSPESEIIEAGLDNLPDQEERRKTASELVADLHELAFAPAPEEAESAVCQDPRRLDFVRKFLESDAGRELRDLTVLDPAGSALAAGSLVNNFAALKKADKAAEEERKRREEEAERPPKPGESRLALRKRGKPDPEVEKMRDELRLSKACAKSADEAKKAVAEMKSAMAACGMGPASAGGRHDSRRALKLYRKVRNNPGLKKIFDWAGRFRICSDGLQRSRTDLGPDELLGVTVGGNIGRLLPSELAALSSCLPGLEVFQLEALVRLAENRSLEWDLRTVSPADKGPVIVCTDQCLHPDTLIPMADGSIKKICEVVVGDQVLSVDFSGGTVHHQRVGRVARIKSPQTLRAVTTTEGSILCSDDHKFFVCVNGKAVERRAAELAPDDLIAVPARLGGYLGGPTTRNSDVEWSQAIGYLFGDGDAWRDKKRGSKRIHMTDENVERLDIYKGIFERAGYCPLIRHWGGRNKLCVNSAALYDLLAEDYPGLLVRQPLRSVPPCVPTWPDERVAAFLRGLFDAEGTAGHHQLSITSSSRALIEWTSLLLHRLGIVAAYELAYSSGFTDGLYPRLNVSDRDSIDQFKALIGFSPGAKQDQLHKICIGKRRNSGGRLQRTECDLRSMSRLADRIALPLTENGINWTLTGRTVTKDRLRLILQACYSRIEALSGMNLSTPNNSDVKGYGLPRARLAALSGLSEKQVARMFTGKSLCQQQRVAVGAAVAEEIKSVRTGLEEFQAIARPELCWTSVKSVKVQDSDVEHLFDLTMDGPYHNYVAGHWVVHNSGSMGGEKHETATALALTVAYNARKQNRWCGLVAYSGDTGHHLLALPPGPWDEDKVVRWLDQFIGGGSNIDVPVRELPRFYEELKAPHARTDIWMISDALCSLPSSVVKTFNDWRAWAMAKVGAIIVGGAPAGDLEKVCDRVFLTPALGVDDEATRAVLST